MTNDALLNCHCKSKETWQPYMLEWSLENLQFSFNCSDSHRVEIRCCSLLWFIAENWNNGKRYTLSCSLSLVAHPCLFDARVQTVGVSLGMFELFN